jgi:hypothetical protein
MAGPVRRAAAAERAAAAASPSAPAADPAGRAAAPPRTQPSTPRRRRSGRQRRSSSATTGRATAHLFPASAFPMTQRRKHRRLSRPRRLVARLRRPSRSCTAGNEGAGSSVLEPAKRRNRRARGRSFDVMRPGHVKRRNRARLRRWIDVMHLCGVERRTRLPNRRDFDVLRPLAIPVLATEPSLLNAAVDVDAGARNRRPRSAATRPHPPTQLGGPPVT